MVNEDENPNIDLNQPCHVASVKFEGLKRSRPSLVGKIVGEIYQSKTLIEFLEICIRIKEKFKDLNSFNDVEIKVKPRDGTNEYDVTFSLDEKSRIIGSFMTSVDNEMGFDFRLSSPNLTGYFDSILGSLSFNKRVFSGQVQYTLPLTPWRHLWSPIYSIMYKNYEWGLQPSGYQQTDWSIINQLSFYSNPHVKHTLSFDNIRRMISSSDPFKTPLAVKEECGHSIKSSIKHILEWDRRIGGNFPSEGVLLKLSNEVTTNLVNGAAKFLRHEINLQANQLIVPKYDLLCQFNLVAGTLLNPQKFNICDKFFAGGPLTLRGIKQFGLGNNIHGHPLGNMSYMSAGLHIYPILPFTTPISYINQNIRPHLFINTGTIGNLNSIRKIRGRAHLQDEFSRFINSLRYTCGFGLVMYLSVVRFELNYCIPIFVDKSDLSDIGFQFGFGIHYT